MFIGKAEAVPFQAHGSHFLSYVAPARGSSQLCAWRLDVAGRTVGTEHKVSHEEVFLVLDGTLTLTIDTVIRDLFPGDVALFPIDASVKVDNPTESPASAWVTTSVGLQAEMTDGSRMSPPWVK